MKNFKQLYIYLLLLSIFSLNLAAATLSDDFEVNDGGWQNHQGVITAPNPINSDVLHLAHQDFSYKIYDFGIVAANAQITINFDFAAVGNWETDDFFGIYFNGAYQFYNSIPGTDGNTDVVTNNFTFNTTLDASGQIILYTLVNSTQSSEEGYIDNVIISTVGTPPIMGNIPDTTVQESTLLNVNLSNYVTTTEGDAIISYGLSCAPSISGMNFSTVSGLFTGYPSTAGSYSCTANATDKDGASNDSTFTITVTAAPQSPPIMLPIPDMSITLNTPANINLSVYVIPTNGDTVTYTLTGTLPAGLTFDANSGIISGQASQEVNATLTLRATDNDEDSNTSTFILSVVSIPSVGTDFRDFSLRYQATLHGKMLTIGNTILVAPDDQDSDVCDNYTDDDYISNANHSNDQYELCHYYDDSNVNFPTTQAELAIPNTIQNIKWVGLYWQSLVQDDYAIENMQIQLKHSQTNSYQTIDYTTLNHNTIDAVVGYNLYAAFADVTSYFVDNNWTNGTVTVGDIPSVEGKIDAIGAYGAWTLVVVYEDDTEPLQNFSVYDGWQKVDIANDIVDVNIGGFYTPKNAPSIDAQVSIFAAEGDKLIAGDTLSVKPSKQASFTELIPNMNSAINTTPAFTRTPNPTNNQGIDIQSFELGSTGKDIILPEESSMTLRFGSVRDTSYNPAHYQDAYFPSMVAFSAQLYTPDICYDYTVTIGDLIPISSDNGDIDTPTFGNLPLKIQFLIRSEEADFTYFDTKAHISFTGGDAGVLTYNRDYTEMSPPSNNSYFTIANGFDEIEANVTSGQINIGNDVIGNASNNGGVLEDSEISYAVLGYDFATTQNQGQLTTHFDLNIETKIRFNPGDIPTNYTFSTAANTDAINYITRCPINPTYSATPLGFNVERVGAEDHDTEDSRYTLYTQVTGRNYSVDIATYAGGLNDGTNTNTSSFKGTVEIELIDADLFQNDSTAGYDTTCQNPKSLGVGELIRFDDTQGEERHTVNIPSDWPGYPNTRSLRNAAFRLWVLSTTDANGTKLVVEHQCDNKTNSDNCFSKLYDDINDTGNCVAECTDYNVNCYPCLKDNYATAICSRDNFSIRPDSYTIALSDRDNDANVNSTIPPIHLKKNDNTDPINLSAGYWYLLDINTTAFNSNSKTIGYHNTQYLAQSNIVTVPSPYNSGALAMLEFSSTNDASCNDKNSSTIPLQFSDGTLISNSHLQFDNVGAYEFWLSDSNWTVVDHADYVYKPRFDLNKNPVDDCVIDSTVTVGKAGCAFHSEQGNHTILHASVRPYRFSMSDIEVIIEPDNARNYTYFNDFTHPYYDDLLLQPIDNANVKFTGLLIAKGKNVDRVSNFTEGCAAEDVILRADIETNPADVNATSPLQQYLQHTNLSDFPNPADTALGYDKNLTLPKVAFPDVLTDGDIKPGKARIYLHSTFKKPKQSPSDPLIASYKAIYASSPDAKSHADLSDMHIPDGDNTYDRDITYYFARVSSLEPLYDNVIPSFRITPLSIDIYCSGLVDCAGDFNLVTNAANGDNNWYADTFYQPTQDGTVDLSISTIFGTPASPAVNPNTDVAFIHADATRTDVNVSVSGTARPTTVDIQIEPVPWLSYNPLDLVYGYPHYRVKFIGNSSWSGVGNTGNVVETTSNRDNINRMNW